MIYRFIYDIEYYLTIPSCIIDTRATNGLANAIGSVIQNYINTQLALIVPGVLTYKLETANGNLVGVLALEVDSMGGATVLFSIIRPAFVSDQANITSQISTFITGNDWVYDI